MYYNKKYLKQAEDKQSTELPAVERRSGFYRITSTHSVEHRINTSYPMWREILDLCDIYVHRQYRKMTIDSDRLPLMIKTDAVGIHRDNLRPDHAEMLSTEIGGFKNEGSIKIEFPTDDNEEECAVLTKRTMIFDTEMNDVLYPPWLEGLPPLEPDLIKSEVDQAFNRTITHPIDPMLPVTASVYQEPLNRLPNDMTGEQVYASNKSVCTGGEAGTGKTYLCNRVIDKCTDDSLPSRVACPTNVAATPYTSASTLHSLFLVGEDTIDTPDFRHLPQSGVFIIDEASMIDTRIWGIIAMCKIFRPKLRFVVAGDFDQHAPIEEGKAEHYVGHLIPRFNQFDKEHNLKHPEGTDLTASYLVWLLKEQDWRCKKTGVKLTFDDIMETRASVDREDNTKGHIKGNVRIITLHQNLKRHDLPLKRFPSLVNVNPVNPRGQFMRWLVDGNYMSLTINRRSDPRLFALSRNVRKTGELNDVVGDDEGTLTHIVRTNKMRRAINAQILQRIAPKLPDGTPFPFFVGMRLISKATRKKLGFVKNEWFTITGISWETQNLVLHGNRTALLPFSLLNKFFEPRYAMTSYKCQGVTIREPYTIHEWKHMDRRGKYASISRGSKYEYVNIAVKKQ